MEASSILGVSPTTLENEFYMVDIPNLIEKKHKEQAADYLMQLQLSQASNNRVMEAENYEQLIRNLTKNFEDVESQVEEKGKLDRQALEALRFMANQGANKTGGR